LPASDSLDTIVEIAVMPESLTDRISRMKESSQKARMAKVIVDQIASTIGVDGSGVVPEATLAGDLGASSLELVELQQALEDTFCIAPLSSAEEKSIKTVSDLIELFWKKLGEGTARFP
jgi:acyl carrier protein